MVESWRISIAQLLANTAELNLINARLVPLRRKHYPQYHSMATSDESGLLPLEQRPQLSVVSGHFLASRDTPSPPLAYSLRKNAHVFTGCVFTSTYPLVVLTSGVRY